MSWMDSWSRPNKQSATPPPLYLTRDDVKYCSTCGRVIGERRSHQKNKVVKYCSDGCREHRPGPVDRKIEKAILALLLGEEGSGLDTTGASGRFRKGDRRNVITCDEIERLVFDRPTAAAEGKADKQSKDSFELTDDDDEAMDDSASKETAEALESQKAELIEKQKAGQKRAREREMVRRAARRAVVFGLVVDDADGLDSRVKDGAESASKAKSDDVPRRKCEALMNGQIVEPSFAKGNWAVRWRE